MSPKNFVAAKAPRSSFGPGVFVGEIIEVSKEVWYKIKYSDGDSEEVSREVALRGHQALRVRGGELEERSSGKWCPALVDMRGGVVLLGM